jgi:hypothetical protein
MSRYSTSGGLNSSSGTLACGSPPAAAAAGVASSLSGLGGSSRQGFVRSLAGGLSSSASNNEDSGALRSSFRPVSTNDGEYLVWVEAFSLTFR